MALVETSIARVIYGAALFTVMKCHGLMKSLGKQIPDFKIDLLLVEQRGGKHR